MQPTDLELKIDERYMYLSHHFKHTHAHFRILGVISTTKYSRIFKAQSLHDARLFALKIVKNEEKFNFRLEAGYFRILDDIINRADRSHIYLESWSENNHFCILMRLLDGNITKIISGLSLDEKIEVMLQLAHQV